MFAHTLHAAPHLCVLTLPLLCPQTSTYTTTHALGYPTAPSPTVCRTSYLCPHTTYMHCHARARQLCIPCSTSTAAVCATETHSRKSHDLLNPAFWAMFFLSQIFPRIFFVSHFFLAFFLVFFFRRQVLLYLMQHLESSQDTVQLIQRRFQFCRSKLDSMRSELQVRHMHSHTCTCVCPAERLIRVLVLRVLHLVCVSSYDSCNAAYVCPDVTHAAPYICVLTLHTTRVASHVLSY